MKRFGLRILPLVGALSVAPGFLGGLSGCGHSDAEMEAKQREIDKVRGDMRALQQKLAEQREADDKKYRDSQDELKKVMDRLREVTNGLESSKDEIDKLMRAKAEYEQRVAQLEEFKKRFAALRDKIIALGQRLTAQGLKVSTRHNRMVIQLPGDVLFASGQDALQPAGKTILKQVADIIRGEPALASRIFQVAGHTDNVEYPQTGPFRDNWGLSVARARTVLVFLITKDEKPRYGAVNPPNIPYGGNLDSRNWSAAGYGAMDPVVGQSDRQSVEEQAKNRRVELVLQPNVEEMLDITKLGQE